MALEEVVRGVVPFPIRAEVVRLRRMPAWRRERGRMALGKVGLAGFPYVLAERASPLRRHGVTDEKLQRGKEANVARAAELISGIAIEPGGMFSYHHAVGRPSRLRGFQVGLELHAGKPSRGVGGGCCQVSNLLYLLALEAGLDVTERHRHALDLFPDHGRTVPFGCGATVFYNVADLRFTNPHPHPVALSLAVEGGHLVGRVLSLQAPALLLGRDASSTPERHPFAKRGKWPAATRGSAPSPGFA